MKYIFFDLDGTLTDPMEGITKGAQYALSKFGINVKNPNELSFFVGPPLYSTFEEKYGFDSKKQKEAVKYYREYYADIGIYENALYDGIDSLLSALKDTGFTLVVATSKPTVFANKVLEHFDIKKYFDFVSGDELDGSRAKKSLVIKHALESLNITPDDGIIMVGDREHDIFGASEFGIPTVAVMFGYGSREEFEAAGAYKIVDTVAQLQEYLVKSISLTEVEKSDIIKVNKGIDGTC